MNTHKEEKQVVDGICVDCEFIYECTIKENAEERGNHIVKCSKFKESK